jgi:hypothetical protein
LRLPEPPPYNKQALSFVNRQKRTLNAGGTNQKGIPPPFVECLLTLNSVMNES